MSKSVNVESWKRHEYWTMNGDTHNMRQDAVYDGKITAQASGANYGVTLRATATMEALGATKIALIKPKSGIAAIELRFRSDGSDGDDSVLQLLASAGVDWYTIVAQLTITQGTQLHSTGIYFCDTIVEASGDWITDTAVIQPTTPGNWISRYVLNTHGYDRFLLIASNLDTTSIYVDWKPL